MKQKITLTLFQIQRVTQIRERYNDWGVNHRHIKAAAGLFSGGSDLFFDSPSMAYTRISNDIRDNWQHCGAVYVYVETRRALNTVNP